VLLDPGLKRNLERKTETGYTSDGEIWLGAAAIKLPSRMLRKSEVVNTHSHKSYSHNVQNPLTANGH
jgi:hypothetical protein